MTVYAWPALQAWGVDRFEMRVLPNTRTFTGPYSPTTQVLDLLGERWIVLMDVPGRTDAALGAALEAFFDRLKGPANAVSLWNLRFPVPQGTLRDGATVPLKNTAGTTIPLKNTAGTTIGLTAGTPVLTSALAQGANTATLRTVPGYTLKAGDMLGLGPGGQLVRNLVDGTADGSGLLPIEFQPRARAAIAAFTVAVWNRPTANFILKAEGVPIVWRPGYFEGAALEWIEAV